jgi:hypothetical protein
MQAPNWLWALYCCSEQPLVPICHHSQPQALIAALKAPKAAVRPVGELSDEIGAIGTNVYIVLRGLQIDHVEQF